MLLLSGVALVSIAIVWHLTAISAFDSTAGPDPTAQRLASARFAATLEPWNVRFGWRVVSLQGLQLFQQGETDAAYWLLLPYSRVVRGDPVFHSIYQQVVSVKTVVDSRKAHVQHGLEGTGGVLPEEDVQH